MADQGVLKTSLCCSPRQPFCYLESSPGHTHIVCTGRDGGVLGRYWRCFNRKLASHLWLVGTQRLVLCKRYLQALAPAESGSGIQQALERVLQTALGANSNPRNRHDMLADRVRQQNEASEQLAAQTLSTRQLVWPQQRCSMLGHSSRTPATSYR